MSLLPCDWFSGWMGRWYITNPSIAGSFCRVDYDGDKYDIPIGLPANDEIARTNIVENWYQRVKV